MPPIETGPSMFMPWTAGEYPPGGYWISRITQLLARSCPGLSSTTAWKLTVKG